MNVSRELSRFKVLRALSRFDEATCGELANVLGAHRKPAIWDILQDAVADGCVTREGERNTKAKYKITDKGRAELRSAA